MDCSGQRAQAGILGVAAPEEYGGGGVDDFRYNAILSEELAAADVLSAGLGLSLQADIALPYLLHGCTPEQAARWLPGIVSGEPILALAMTEPGAGSDVAGIATTGGQARRPLRRQRLEDVHHQRLNADLVVTAVKTDPSAAPQGHLPAGHRAAAGRVSRAAEAGEGGAARADTAELFFDDVRVPAANLLGEEGRGFYAADEHLAQERLSIAVQARPRPGARSGSDARLRQGAPRRSASRSARSRTTGSCSPR